MRHGKQLLINVKKAKINHGFWNFNPTAYTDIFHQNGWVIKDLIGVKGTTRSATGFMTTTDYYEGVSESFRSELDEMILIHNFTPGKINPGLNDMQDNLMYKNMCPFPDTEIPLVIQSPGCIKGLHYSFNTVTGIKGMSDHDAELVLSEIRKGLEPYTYDHSCWTNTFAKR